MRTACRILLLLFFSWLCSCNIFLDVGSSGTKIFGDKVNAATKKKTFNVLEADASHNGAKYKGLAAAAIAQAKQVALTTFKFKFPVSGLDIQPSDINDEPDQVLHEYVKTIFEATNKLGESCVGRPVYALATAGMRVPEIPASAMPAVCKMKDLPYNCAFDPKWCRVTPGTEEGWYEWIAVHTGKSSRFPNDRSPIHATGGPIGIISMGGASAQIAIPLTQDKVAPWKNLIQLALKNQGEWFERTTHPMRDDYYHNFIDIRTPENTPYWQALGSMRAKGGKTYVAVGVLSFLGLSDRSNMKGGDDSTLHIMGGINSFDLLTKKYVTGSSSTCTNWAECLTDMENLLKKDPFFKAAITHLRTHHIQQPFVFFDKISPIGNDMRSKEKSPDTAWCTPKASRTKAGQVIGSILKLNSDTFVSCSGADMINYLNSKCGTVEAMKSEEKLVDGSFNTCHNTLARTAISRLIFGKDSFTTFPRRPVVNVLAFLDGAGLGDPHDGAEWVIKRSQDGASMRTDRAAARCVAKSRGKGVKLTKEQVAADKACPLKKQPQCTGNCQWVDPNAKKATRTQAKATNRVVQSAKGKAKQACTHPGKYKSVCGLQLTKTECYSYVPNVCLWGGKPGSPPRESDESVGDLFNNYRKRSVKRLRKSHSHKRVEAESEMD